MAYSRREFSRLLGASALASTLGAPYVGAQAKAKVVLVGGGAGGASCAVALKKAAPELDVTLVEVQPTYMSCFFSNLYLGGVRTPESLTHNYDGLKKLGITIVQDWADAVDTKGKSVTLKGGQKLAYDRLVLSPGIDLIYESIPGYSLEASETLPHAWKAGVQTQILRRQLVEMKDGGTVVMVAPDNPYRCPPGPYERASMIAHYLKSNKPKSKLIVLDPKKAFSKQPVFLEGFEKHYKNILDMKLSNDIDSFAVTKLDAKTKEIETKSGFKVKADVANIVPNQRAGAIAFKAGVNEGNWVPVDPETFKAKKAADVFVLGDATIAAEMPKSAFSANSQAKVAANVIASELAGKQKFPARFRNTCWSLIAPNDTVKVGANYKPAEGKLAPEASFVSQKGEAATVREANFKESLDWYASITGEMFNKS
jgi:NADPH-dependent 2,4-dienoyl-CoA reductase/sulfur reductase-like enzyme